MARGRKTGGRRAGTPNKLTADARETFRLLFEALAPEAEGWIRAAARKNPAKGAELLLKVSEMFVPRLVRQEPEGATGDPLVVTIREFSDDPRNMTDEQLARAVQEHRRREVRIEALERAASLHPREVGNVRSR